MATRSWSGPPVAPAATDLGVLTTYRWTAEGERLVLAVSTEPVGSWTGVLPRLGLLMSGPAGLDRLEWLGFGPGEAYPDSRRVDDLQTPYVLPQENGNRTGVRWARITSPDSTACTSAAGRRSS